MRDEDKSKEDLINELQFLRRRLLELEPKSNGRIFGCEANPTLTAELEPTAKTKTMALIDLNERLLAEATERARAEAALRTAKEQLEAVLAAVPGIVSWVSADLRYLGVNRHLAQMFNLSPDDFLGQHIGFLGTSSEFYEFVCQFFVQSDREAFKEIIAKVNDEPRHFLLVAQKYNQNQAAFIVGIDITERQQAVEALQRMATLDGLTQVANRRYFDEMLEQLWRRLKREQRSLSIILCDVDYFKRYNDTYGHLAGDECLKQIAQAIASAVKRPEDVVARYGGEEFVVLLPNTPLEGAATVAENIRQGIIKLNIPHAESKASNHITVSIGLASAVPQASLHPEQLFAAADRALYQSKALGRDRITLAPSPEIFPLTLSG